MDLVEKLARLMAESMNGGEFYDGKWYTEDHRKAWRNAVTKLLKELEKE